MSYDHIGIWSKDLQAFRNHSNKFGLDINEDAWQESGTINPQGDWQLAGPFTLVKVAGTYDAEGIEITPPVMYAGMFWNARVYGQLLTDIRGENVQTEIIDDVEVLKPFLDRSEIGKVTAGATTRKAVGTNTDNPKRPVRMSVGLGPGTQFEVYEGPMGQRTDITSPYNVWA